MARSLFEKVLSCPSLPSLPVVAAELLDLTSDPDVPMRKIAEVVQRDQALAGKVLKTVNSSFYGLSTPCGSIDRAMALLGLNTVKSLVLGFSLVDTTRTAEREGFDLMAHWRRAIVGAVSSREVALLTRAVDGDEAFTAGLFQDIGVLACFVALKGGFADIVAGHHHAKWCAIEREALGFTHGEVGEALAKKWKLPASIQAAIGGHHRPERTPEPHADLAKAVALGSMVGSVLAQENPVPTVRQIEASAKAWFGKRAPDVGELLARAAEDAKTMARLFAQDIGELPDTQVLLAAAQEKNLEHQIDLQRQAESLTREATTDALTGLANRKKFDAELERAFAEFGSLGRSMAVIFIDADHFKAVNDTHGHAAGDAVLIELARRIESVVGAAGVVGRYGGEEVAVVLPGLGIDAGAVLGERIRAEVAATPFDLSKLAGAPATLVVTISVGVAATDGDKTGRYAGAQQLLADADACVYDAKRAGRNRVFVHRPSDENPVVPTSSAPVSPGGVRVLFVEDDPLAATLITTLLKRQKTVDIQWIESGTRARTEIGRMDAGEIPPVDVFLVDLNLPGTSGYDLLKMVRASARLRGVPFLVLSGEGGESTRAECLRLGADEFIHKQDFVMDIGRWVGLILRGKPGRAA